jgi:hypothetical protein
MRTQCASCVLPQRCKHTAQRKGGYVDYLCLNQHRNGPAGSSSDREVARRTWHALVHKLRCAVGLLALSRCTSVLVLLSAVMVTYLASLVRPTCTWKPSYSCTS